MLHVEVEAAAPAQMGTMATLLAAQSLLLTEPAAGFFLEGDEEDEDGDVSMMIQVGVTTKAPKKRVTGMPVEDECAWGECDEEEDDGAMFMQSSVKESVGASRLRE